MKTVLDEWIVREVIHTLYMARTTLLGITGLDSPQEVAEKSANETTITRRISKAIDLIQQQSGNPEVDLEKLGEIARHLIAVKDHEEDMRLDEGEWLLLEKIGYPERF